MFVFENQPITIPAFSISLIPIICSLVTVYCLFTEILDVGKFRRLLVLLHPQHCLAEYRIIRRFRFIYPFKSDQNHIGYSLNVLGQLFRNGDSQIFPGSDRNIRKNYSLYVFFYCYLLSFGSIWYGIDLNTQNTLIKAWTTYGLAVLPATYILYNLQIFFLLYLLYKESKITLTVQSTASTKKKSTYKKIKLYFSMVEQITKFTFVEKWF
jgi:hypothetical protein